MPSGVSNTGSGFSGTSFQEFLARSFARLRQKFFQGFSSKKIFDFFFVFLASFFSISPGISLMFPAELWKFLLYFSLKEMAGKLHAPRAPSKVLSDVHSKISAGVHVVSVAISPIFLSGLLPVCSQGFSRDSFRKCLLNLPEISLRGFSGRRTNNFKFFHRFLPRNFSEYFL